MKLVITQSPRRHGFLWLKKTERIYIGGDGATTTDLACAHRYSGYDSAGDSLMDLWGWGEPYWYAMEVPA